MATRSLVGILEDGLVSYVYVHMDGYLDGVGSELVQKYKNKKAVKALIQKGSSSSLGENFYDEPPMQVELSDFSCGDHGSEYIYLFLNNRWIYESYEQKDVWKRVSNK
jgi:hypothetical protein